MSHPTFKFSPISHKQSPKMPQGLICHLRTGGGCLQESNHKGQGASSERRSRHITEGAIESVRIKRVEYRENVRAVPVKPRCTYHRLTQTPYYYGQFALSLGKESPFIFSEFNPLNTDTFCDPLSVRINGC